MHDKQPNARHYHTLYVAYALWLGTIPPFLLIYISLTRKMKKSVSLWSLEFLSSFCPTTLVVHLLFLETQLGTPTVTNFTDSARIRRIVNKRNSAISTMCFTDTRVRGLRSKEFSRSAAWRIMYELNKVKTIVFSTSYAFQFSKYRNPYWFGIKMTQQRSSDNMLWLLLNKLEENIKNLQISNENWP